MTSIPYASLYSSNALATLGTSGSSTSQQSGDSGFEALLDGISSDSATAQNAAADTSNPTDNIGQLLQYIQQVVSSTENTLLNIGSDSSAPVQQAAATNPFTPTGASATDPFLTGGGPLPAFLAQVDVAYHLNATQSQALRDIAVQFKDVTKTPDNIQKIADALTQAGIGTPAVNT